MQRQLHGQKVWVGTPQKNDIQKANKHTYKKLFNIIRDQENTS